MLAIVLPKASFALTLLVAAGLDSAHAVAAVAVGVDEPGNHPVRGRPPALDLRPGRAPLGAEGFAAGSDSRSQRHIFAL
jgi:hypothetical protein